MESLVVKSIGIIHTPFTGQAGTPIQSRFGQKAEGTVEVFSEFVPALGDLDGFERIWLLYWLHRSRAFRPLVKPYRDKVERGLFATRAPARPNPIGMSVVDLLAIEGNRLRIRGVDILDQTPLLDIKPYVPEFDSFPDSRAGWLDRSTTDNSHADDRFED